MGELVVRSGEVHAVMGPNGSVPIDDVEPLALPAGQRVEAMPSQRFADSVA